MRVKMSGKNRSWLPLGVSKKIQPRMAKKASYTLWHWNKTLRLLWDYSRVRRGFQKEAGHEREEWMQRLRNRRQGLERKQRRFCILSAGCLWTMDRGRRARAYGAHLPVQAEQDLAWWSRWPVERDALGQTRAWYKGSKKCAFKQQHRVLQKL